MRYAVIADVHGNLPALQAVLAAAGTRRLDGYLSLGDLVGYGPFPNECVATVAGLAPVGVAGNHDLMALGLMSDDQCIRLARRTLRWTRSVLDGQARTHLASLPIRREAPGGVVLAHGSLDDPREYVTEPDRAAEQLRRLSAEHAGASVLLVGHTHRAWACRSTGEVLVPGADGVVFLGDGPVLLNPGAVGQSREGRVRARFLVLDTDARTATFLAVRYDVRRTRDELRRHRLPARTYRLRRSVLGRVRRGAGRLLRG